MPEIDIRILVVADNVLARTGLAALLTTSDGCRVVGQTPGDNTLITELDVYRPDVVVYDLGWTPVDALDNLTDLRDATMPVVALLPDEEQAAEVVATLANGGTMAVTGDATPYAFGLLLRDGAPETLVSASSAVVDGLIVIEPLLASAVLRETSILPELPAESLTPRESEVLQLIAEGLANKAIARKLGISDHTVKFHVNAILGKLNAQSRTEAVVRATRLGLIVL